MKIELCPETGIGMLLKEDGTKVDLMPDEVGQLRDAGGDAGKIKAAIASVDPGFAGVLSDENIAAITERFPA